MSAPGVPPVAARVLLRHPAGWLATGLGAGLSPVAPGTAGTLLALVPWWLWLRHLPPWHYALVLGCAFALGGWAADWAIAKLGRQDPGAVVIDEFVGVWLALFLAPAGWPWLLAGFALFRLFDIWKPWPVRWADRRVHGGFGTMLDDLLAGAWAWLLLQLALAFLPRVA
jgi:phosphatidylglycerophosphatase A